MDTEEARDFLRDIAKFGEIRLSKHCRKRMQERLVTADDILNVLFWGTIQELSLQDGGYWKCNVVGTDIDGEDLTFCTVFSKEENFVLCVTVF